MAGKPKVYPVELVEAFEAALLARASIRSASEACGITKTVGRNIVARNPRLRALIAAPGALSVSHGKFGTPEYRTWAAMKNRCLSTSSKDYPSYGARGIRVCAAWQSFENFLADMGPRPLGTSLDRRDNGGHYSCGKCEECVANGWPANCRWATAGEQAGNRRSSRLFTIGGVTLTMTEWARRSGLRSELVRDRVNRGVPIESALGAR